MLRQKSGDIAHFLHGVVKACGKALCGLPLCSSLLSLLNTCSAGADDHGHAVRAILADGCIDRSAQRLHRVPCQRIVAGAL